MKRCKIKPGPGVVILATNGVVILALIGAARVIRWIVDGIAHALVVRGGWVAESRAGDLSGGSGWSGAVPVGDAQGKRVLPAQQPAAIRRDRTGPRPQPGVSAGSGARGMMTAKEYVEGKVKF